jgi:hypothetical protein
MHPNVKHASGYYRADAAIFCYCCWELIVPWLEAIFVSAERKSLGHNRARKYLVLYSLSQRNEKPGSHPAAPRPSRPFPSHFQSQSQRCLPIPFLPPPVDPGQLRRLLALPTNRPDATSSRSPESMAWNRQSATQGRTLATQDLGFLHPCVGLVLGAGGAWTTSMATGRSLSSSSASAAKTSPDLMRMMCAAAAAFCCVKHAVPR